MLSQISVSSPDVVFATKIVYAGLRELGFSDPEKCLQSSLAVASENGGLKVLLEFKHPSGTLLNVEVDLKGAEGQRSFDPCYAYEGDRLLARVYLRSAFQADQTIDVDVSGALPPVPKDAEASEAN